MKRHTAFITGAGRNIGRAIALELARRGMNIVLNGRSDRASCDEVAALCTEAGIETLVLMGDVGSAEECARLSAAALERFGTIDVLVTSAAMRPNWPLLETTDAQWQQVMDLNLGSVFWLSRAFLPGMAAQGWGRVIGFSGMHAIRGAHKGPVAASKHGQWGLMKAISHEFAAQGITANAISPGPIGPELESFSHGGEKPVFPKLIPMGRRGTPEEVAAFVGVIASEEGGYMTGQMIAINGGGTT